MKKWMIVFMTAVLALGISACGAKQNEGSESTSSGDTEIANPIKDAAEDDFELLGVKLTAPENAEDVKLSTIGDEVGQVVFTLDGHEYTYRGGKTEEDISGIYDEFEGDPISYNVPVGDLNVEVTTKVTAQGAYLSEWMWDNVKYSLYTADNVGDGVMTDLYTALATSSCPE